MGLILAITLSSCEQNSKKERPVQSSDRVPSATTVQNDLPNLSLTTIEGAEITIKNQPGKVILILFQPECDDCQREAVQIKDNMEAFKGYSVYFISSAAIPEITSFSKEYKLDGFENVIFGQTSVQNVLNTLGPIPAPSVYIYSNEGKLMKQFNGEVDISEIKAAL